MRYFVVLIFFFVFLNAKNLEPDFNKTAALKELFEISHIEKSYNKMIDIATKRVIAKKPILIYGKKEIKEFYKKYLSWKAIEPEAIKLYAKYFTLEEINELIKFYKTDVGQKSIKIFPKLTLEAQKIGYKMVMKHKDELKKIMKKIDERVKKELDKADADE